MTETNDLPGFLNALADSATAIRLSVALVLAGLALIAVGLVLRHKMRSAMPPGSIPVRLRVIAVSEVRSGKDQVAWRPEFEIIDGPHKGVRRASDATSAPPVHEVGDTDDGLYDRASGALESQSVLKMGTKVAALCKLAGAVLTLLGVLAFLLLL